MSSIGDLRSASALVERTLRDFMDGRTLPLYTMMSYHLGWVDENGEAVPPAEPDRLRGAVCLYSAAAAGGTPDSAALSAAAVELAHNYSLIHCDIQEGNPDRGANPALWWVWGPAQGINAGDGMHALARLAIFSMREQGVAPEVVSVALKTLDEAILSLCEGSYIDTVFQERLSVSVDEYLDMAHALGGRLISAAARLGVLASGNETPELAEGLAEYGLEMGTALRIAEDYDALWPATERDGAAQGRLIAKKKTLPVVHAMEKADPAVRRELGNMYAQRVIDPANLDRVRNLLDTSGSREYTAGVIRELADRAGEGLSRAGLDRETEAGFKDLIEKSIGNPVL